MEKNLDKFISAIKKAEKPFEYKDTIVYRDFMLSYDESIDALDDEDFRPYIIAALHAKGATNLDSEVASTITFKAPYKKGESFNVLNNWKNYLVDVFGKEITFKLSISRSFDDGDPVSISVPDPSIKSAFVTRYDSVKTKFKTLK